MAAMLVAASCSTQSETTETTDTPASTTSTGSTSEEASSLTCWTSPAPGVERDPAFVDVTSDMGLDEPLKGMHGHAGIWTDANGDSVPDLFVGTFADREDSVYQERGASGPSPDRLLLGGSSFSAANVESVFSRTSGGATADLDSDGDLDLVVARNIKDIALGQEPTSVYGNNDGSLVAVESGLPADLGGRSVAFIDYDADGSLDIFVVVDQYAGEGSRLFRNEGGLEFEDVTSGAGLPTDVVGLGVVVADFNNDTINDVFVSGSNRLFLGTGSGFDEASDDVFEWETFGPEDDVAGVSAADVNRDGNIDLVVGHHFNSTVDFGERVPIRLYLNDGSASFTDVTEAAELTPLPTKAPHVEFVDLNNDGWFDILTSASSNGGPAVFIHDRLEDGIPVYKQPDGLGDLQYWVGAPTSDFNRDGLVDVFLVEWEPSLPSLLLQNTTEGGNWIETSVSSEFGNGIGWRVDAFDSDGNLIAARHITSTQGYSAGVLPTAHFGLGDVDMVNLRLTPLLGEPIELHDVAANQHLRWPDGC